MNDDQIKNHGTWSLVNQAYDRLSEYDHEQQRSPQYQEAKEKVDYLAWVIEQSDPKLLTPQALDQIQPPLQQVVNHIAGSSGNSNRLPQLDQWFNQIFDKFPYPRVRKIFRSERTEILNEFEQDIVRIQSQAQTIQEDMEKWQEAKTTELQKIASTLDQINKEIATNEARVAAEFENLESRVSKEVNDRLTELNSEFSSDQAVRRDEHEKQLDAIAAQLREIEDLKKNTSDSLNTALLKLEKDAAQKHAETESAGEGFLSKIKEIYQISGQTALAGDFEKAAKEENVTGIVFGVFAALFFAAAPIVFTTLWFRSAVEGVNFGAMALKLSAAFAFLVPAAYFGSTSKRHHRVATSLRALGIKVATFDAYLADFPEGERTRLKEQMAATFFDARISPDHIRSGSPKQVETILDLADSTISKAQDLVKTMKPE